MAIWNTKSGKESFWVPGLCTLAECRWPAGADKQDCSAGVTGRGGLEPEQTGSRDTLSVIGKRGDLVEETLLAQGRYRLYIFTQIQQFF